MGRPIGPDKAKEREFGINYAVYRNVDPEFEDFLEYGSDLKGLNYCFWVFKRDVKIGGVIIRLADQKVVSSSSRALRLQDGAILQLPDASGRVTER